MAGQRNRRKMDAEMRLSATSERPTAAKRSLNVEKHSLNSLKTKANHRHKVMGMLGFKVPKDRPKCLKGRHN